jgi:hypothetical protein
MSISASFIKSGSISHFCINTAVLEVERTHKWGREGPQELLDLKI